MLYHNLHNIGYQITQQNKYDIIIVKIQFTQFGIIMLDFHPKWEECLSIYGHQIKMRDTILHYCMGPCKAF